MKKRNLRRIALQAGVMVATASISLLGTSAAWANGTNAGAVTVTQPDASTPLNSGGSQTPFTLVLPSLAACSKDTTTGSYHVYGYIVPSSIDPATLTFTSTGPTDPTANALDYPLIIPGTGPYANVNTATTTGQVPQPPTLTYAAFGTGGTAIAPLPAGTYNVGVACATNTGAGDKFWNVQETFTANSNDANGVVWSTNPGTQVPESPLTVALPLSAVVLMGLGVVVVRRRRHSAESVTAA